MTASYTFDVFSSLNGCASISEGADWGGYWGKQGPELLEERLGEYSGEQRLVLGANTYRVFASMIAAADEDSEVFDPWVTAMSNLPTTVISNSLDDPLDWPNATLVRGDAVDVVARMKEESDIPIRSHGSLSMNRALLDAGLVDRLEVTIFPALTGRTGTESIFDGVGDFDLELLYCRTFDGRTQELIYRPEPH